MAEKRSIATAEVVGRREPKLRRIVSMEDINVETATTCKEVQQRELVDPVSIIIALLRYKGVNAATHGYKDVNKFFYNPGSKDLASYSSEVMAAVCSGNVEALKKLKEQGVQMSCCNNVGESILQTACRKGQTEVVRYLVEEAGVPVNTCDDYGRTPLHDAFWASQPNFQVIGLLLGKCPDLLLIEDMRGHTPMRFAPKDQWRTLVKHLARNFYLVKPKVLQQKKMT